MCLDIEIVTRKSKQKEVLKKQAHPLGKNEWELASEIAKKLLKALKPHLPAAGLAAPQIGISRSIFLYSFDRNPKHLEAAVNPSFEPVEEEKVSRWEACFSVTLSQEEWKVALVPRYRKIKARYFDLQGKEVEKILEGLGAQVFQHECDHLMGIVNIERPDAKVVEFATEKEFLAFMAERKKEDEAFSKHPSLGVLEKQPKVPLAFLPTPVQRLFRTEKALKGPCLLMKRDDLTGLAFGGNKTRKLEYLLADAQIKGADLLLTAGALQSNHCRQTAAAAAQLGLECTLLLHGQRPKDFEGNLLLDALFGADIHWKTKDETLEDLAEEAIRQGKKPYVIPYGGSNLWGALGYVNAMVELAKQQKNLDQQVTHLVFAACSGATHVGLKIGADLVGFSGKIIAVSIEQDAASKDAFEKDLALLASEVAAHLQFNRTYRPEDFSVDYEYAKGYGVLGELEKEAIYFLAQQEGILLDPVYSARAFGALLDKARTGVFSKEDTVLFLHTGGTPALFPYGKALLQKEFCHGES